MSNVTLDKKYITTSEEASVKFTYGDIISKEWLVEKFELTAPTYGTQRDFNSFALEFMTCVEGFKSHMLSEHKMLLESVRSVGYKIVHPADQTDVTMRTLKSTVAKEINRAVDRLTHINEELLSLEDIRRKDECQGKIAALAAFSRKRITS